MKARETLHLVRAREVAPIAVRRLEGESDWHYAARVKSIHALSVNWQSHPSYQSPARHSVHEAVWRPARAAFLAAIASEARSDRSRNPAHQQWERVRAVLGVE